MQTSISDVSTLINNMAAFNQAIAGSAANMKANFDAQIAGISQSFGAVFQRVDGVAANSAANLGQAFGSAAQMTAEEFSAVFAGINTAALDSSLVLSTNFLEALSLINAGIAETQASSTLSFGQMSTNAMSSFLLAVLDIITNLTTLNGSIAISCAEMELLFSTAFSNIVEDFSTNLELMNQRLEEAFLTISKTTAVNAVWISGIMLVAFGSIIAGMEVVELLICSKLENIKNKFEETAQNAIKSFEEAQISISGSMNGIGNVSTINIGKVIQVTADASGGQLDFIGVISNVISIFADLITILGAFNLLQTASTALTIADTIANTANTASEIYLSSAMAGVTLSLTGAAAGMAAFGFAAQALGDCVLMVGMAVALVAKTIFNFIKLTGADTHGVKASDFDLNFSIKGFADGGFPSMGQMFIAREAGPELVGRIGSRTAVANNDQIVAGISQGVRGANEDVINVVYTAARQIVNAINRNGGDIYLDGEKVGSRTTQIQDRQNRMYGKCLQNV